MKKTLLITFIIALALISCKKEKIEGKIKTDKKFAAELRSSPETITIGNNNLMLTTLLWRDFMPAAEENGSKMICINILTEVNKNSILSSITLKKQYVIKDNIIWTANYSEIRNNNDYNVEGVVRNGPKWGPNIEVDVVCEFDYAGTTQRIMAKSQFIQKTE